MKSLAPGLKPKRQSNMSSVGSGNLSRERDFRVSLTNLALVKN
ncbi:hypothetical protein CZ809_00208 [Photobacterium piscicola]|uniref:Uncharacterized protein n=1 Tax=Photobacterium piscicola TaxID=1378299 RepID=A0A1T5HV65_9GAMM|nr:hypothetical protein [Photobacterium piscicola]SKC30731.1 hypothetical protein CZ809_00208 [Photobacterium piscicola]